MEDNKLKSFESSFNKLKTYIENEKFKGWDPFDGLNSKVFQATPLKHWDIARLAWIQGFKRSPINFRKLLLVPKEYNAKGIGLLLSAYCNLYHISSSGNSQFGTKEEHLEKIIFLAAPTVVATNFCFNALLDAYEITKTEKYLTTALSAVNFVVNDLSRTLHHNGFLFSYSPLNGNNTVYNASLLGAMLLSRSYLYSKNEEHLKIARSAVLAACEGQNEDGSWVYGMLPVQSWIDSFHTGYNLNAIITYQKVSNDFSFKSSLEKGFDYYMQHFFEADGTPKYYNNKTYPIDIHCPAQLFVTLSKFGAFLDHKDLAEKVMNWSICNMQDKNGYFYYQLKKGMSSKISYMRWSNAFMFNAMTYYLKEKLAQ
ncbi:MAG: delta-aminolevulinic acid dehydratase [Crocinitomicaceae bacterium]|nr:delta-aminolevulinic acid dehydratase [Crocinitomicaceae bacterium]